MKFIEICPLEVTNKPKGANWRQLAPFLYLNITKNLRLCGGAHPFQFLTENLNPACTDINVIRSTRV